MSLFLFLCIEAAPVIRVPGLSTNLIPTDPSYYSYVCNVFGAYMKGVDLLTALIYF